MVKCHGFRIYETSDYVIIFGCYIVKKRSKNVYIENRYMAAILMKHSSDLDVPTRKVKVI